MNPMKNDKYYGLALTLIVLISTITGGAKHEGSEDTIFYSQSEPTSLTATAKNNFPETQTALATVALEIPPAISAVSAVVKYLDTNEAIFSVSQNQQWPIASLTKLMTAVVAVENIPADAKIKISEKAIATEGGAGNIVAGKAYTREELLKVLLKVSSNDAAAAFSEFLGREIFLELMNQKAISLGMYNTRYFDSSGLSALNQSMASDLEKLVIYIYNRHPEILAITREPEGNIHPFAAWANFLGGKTGFIDEASGNLISLFNYRGRPLLIVVLGSEDRAKDTQVLYDYLTSR